MITSLSISLFGILPGAFSWVSTELAFLAEVLEQATAFVPQLAAAKALLTLDNRLSPLLCREQPTSFCLKHQLYNVIVVFMFITLFPTFGKAHCRGLVATKKNSQSVRLESRSA